MIRRPPRSTLDRSSAASDVYKRQPDGGDGRGVGEDGLDDLHGGLRPRVQDILAAPAPVSYTHLRAHETVLDLVCRLLLEKKKTNTRNLRMIVHGYIQDTISPRPTYLTC